MLLLLPLLAIVADVAAFWFPKSSIIAATVMWVLLLMVILVGHKGKDLRNFPGSGHVMRKYGYWLQYPSTETNVSIGMSAWILNWIILAIIVGTKASWVWVFIPCTAILTGIPAIFRTNPPAFLKRGVFSGNPMERKEAFTLMDYCKVYWPDEITEILWEGYFEEFAVYCKSRHPEEMMGVILERAQIKGKV